MDLRLPCAPDRLPLGRHNGPGLRLMLYVQGCRLRCTPRCLNPQLQSMSTGILAPHSEVTRAILAIRASYPELEGITLLGGEPFEQAAALYLALAPLASTGLSLMAYSGFTREQLAGREDGARLLSRCDLLVDGPFREELHDPGLIWRGSSNQRILRLSDRYSEDDLARAMAAQGRASAISVSPAGQTAISGFQDHALA